MADKEKKVVEAEAKPQKAKKEKVKLSARLGKFWRDYKSELKKIVWCPWKQVKNNTVVVVVIVVLTSALIGLLDFGFSQAISLLGGLF